MDIPELRLALGQVTIHILKLENVCTWPMATQVQEVDITPGWKSTTERTQQGNLLVIPPPPLQNTKCVFRDLFQIAKSKEISKSQNIKLTSWNQEYDHSLVHIEYTTHFPFSKMPLEMKLAPPYNLL